MELVLELTGDGKNRTKKKKLSLECQVVTTTTTKSSSNLPQQRWTVKYLPSSLDSTLSDELISLLSEELDRHSSSVRIAKLYWNGIGFSDSGAVESLCRFWKDRASGTVRHLSIQGVFSGRTKDNHKDDEKTTTTTMQSVLLDDENREWMKEMMSVFSQSPLTVLDLSQNTLRGSDIWQALMNFPGQGDSNNNKFQQQKFRLKQLILDSVDLDEESWVTFSENLAIWDTLDDLHVVLECGPTSTRAWEASLHILRSCKNLSSLRWIQKRNPYCPLPLQGLRDNLLNTTLVNPSTTPPDHKTTLRHLIFEGPGTLEFFQPQDMADLASIVQNTVRLKTLKLRHLGLTDVAILVNAIRMAGPPLQVIDLSYNEISPIGARPLIDLQRICPKSLNSLVLHDNRLDTTVAKELMETFGSICSLQNNRHVDFHSILTDLWMEKLHLEWERNELRRQIEMAQQQQQQSMTNQNANKDASLANRHLDSSNAWDKLQTENRLLRQDRDKLIRAFALIGTNRSHEQQQFLFDRIQRLEDVVLSSSSSTRTMNNGNPSARSLVLHHPDNNSNNNNPTLVPPTTTTTTNSSHWNSATTSLNPTCALEASIPPIMESPMPRTPDNSSPPLSNRSYSRLPTSFVLVPPFSSSTSNTIANITTSSSSSLLETSQQQRSTSSHSSRSTSLRRTGSKRSIMRQSSVKFSTEE